MSTTESCPKSTNSIDPGDPNAGGNGKHMIRAVEELLRRLRTDYLDL
jgi:aryl-alcohol dehydrogenase-like predicted oxidoreductase